MAYTVTIRGKLKGDHGIDGLTREQALAQAKPI